MRVWLQKIQQDPQLAIYKQGKQILCMASSFYARQATFMQGKQLLIKTFGVLCKACNYEASLVTYKQG